jgi:chromosome segregation ATPase
LSKREEPEIPSITLDHDQVKSVQAKPTAPVSRGNKKIVKSNQSSSSAIFIAILLPLAALAGASWFFYQETLKVNQLLINSERRILQLENQLSATGEEMGESTIALKVKLEAIGEQTDLLLKEMDKLWASAWRRNQAEIKEIRSVHKKLEQKHNKASSTVTELANITTELKDKQTAFEFSVDALGEQLNAANNIKSEITQLTSQLTTLDENSKTRDKQQMVVATSMNELDTTLQLMFERIEHMEGKLKALQLKSSNSPTP